MGYTGGNSTSFQIRLELIKVAKDLLEFDYGQKQQELDNIWVAQIEDWEKGTRGIGEGYPLPKQAGAPTVDEVLAVAEKLNGFVSDGGGRGIQDSNTGLEGLTLSVDTSHIADDPGSDRIKF